MSRHHRNMSSREWERVRRACFERDGHVCQMPGCRVRWPLEAHHVVPLSAGGEEFDVDNLLTLCTDHHVELHREYEDEQRRKWQEFVNELLEG